MLRSYIMVEYERRTSENGKLHAELKALKEENVRLLETIGMLQRKDENSEERLSSIVRSISEDRTVITQSLERIERQYLRFDALLDDIQQKDTYYGKAVEDVVESNRKIERIISALREDGKTRDARINDMVRRMATLGKERTSQVLDIDQSSRIIDLSNKLEAELNIEISYLKEIERLQAELDKTRLKYANLASSPLGRLNLFIWKIYNKITRVK